MEHQQVEGFVFQFLRTSVDCDRLSRYLDITPDTLAHWILGDSEIPRTKLRKALTLFGSSEKEFDALVNYYPSIL